MLDEAQSLVTADAVTDEKKGSYYPATLTLAAKDMLIDGKRVNLSPGMNITAEIKTGQRRTSFTAACLNRHWGPILMTNR